MKRSVIGGIASSVIASSALADPASSSTTSAADAKRQVLKLEREWTAAEIKRDAATLRRILDDRFIVTFGAGGYAEDAVWNAPGAPAAHGRTAIHEYFRKDMAASAAAGLTFKFDPVINVGVSANLGQAEGTYTLTDKSGVAVDTGKYVTVYGKKDETWQILRDIYNSNVPAVSATPIK